VEKEGRKNLKENKERKKVERKTITKLRFNLNNLNRRKSK
jgi:hypothetical protein